MPDQPWAAIAVPDRLLAELARTIRAGNKVLVMAYEPDVGNLACEAVERMLDMPYGAA
ncbi:hypothetical protein [Roseomonas sp. BN140053]|uniref:hypothetical protein n=1 Tax=Roseomonas sp. BN140053 TaxID=3391898 RepID=UPI0039EC6246